MDDLQLRIENGGSARFSGGDGCCGGSRRGRPVCRPVGGSRAEAFPGGHIGPPLHGGRSARQRRAGRDGARPLQRWSRPMAAGCVTESAQRAGRCGHRPLRETRIAAGCGHPALRVHHRWCAASGPMYLRHGLRRPNFVSKFGASVKVVVPYGGVFPWSLHFVENFFRERGGSPLDGEGKRCYLESLQARMGLAARSRGRKCPPVCPVSGKRVWMRPNSGGTTDRYDSP